MVCKRNFPIPAVIIMVLMLLFLSVSVSSAAMGSIEDVVYRGITSDIAGTDGSFQPDSVADPCFSVTITGAGALTGFSVRTEDGSVIWDSSPGAGEWALAVEDSDGDMINKGGSAGIVPFILGASFRLYPGNDGFFETRTRKYIVEVRFVDGSSTSSTVEVKAVKEEPQPVDEEGQPAGNTYAYLSGFSERDLAGPDESLAPDGNDDVMIVLQLVGNFTVSSLEVRNATGRFSVWDTVPSNGRWSLVVTDDQGNILNNTDGSFSYGISDSKKFKLLFADNGSVEAGDTTYKVIVRFNDGNMIEVPVNTQITGSITPLPGLQLAEKENSAIFYGKADGQSGANIPEIMQYENDYVSASENISRDGYPDWGMAFTPGFEGKIISFKIRNEGGEFGVWDTLPDNGRWAIAVTDDYGQLLNESNGSIDIDVDPGSRIWLWIADNGSLGNSSIDHVVTVMTDQGETYTIKADKHQSFAEIKPQVKPQVIPDLPKLIEFKARYIEKSMKDRVGKYDRIKSDSNRDVKIRIYVEGLDGTIKEVILKDSMEMDMRWDTVPDNGRWAILVTTTGETPLNNTDGSVSIPVKGKKLLLLWVADNGKLSSGEVPFEVLLRTEDGRVLSAPLDR